MRRASARLHFLLFAGLAPLAWPITLITAIGSWRARAEDRRPLVALAAVDGLVLLGVVSLFLGARAPELGREPPTTPPVIGVRLDDAPGGGAVIEPVEGGPADRAGLRAGDVVVAIDGEAIDDVDALQRAVREGPMAARTFEVRRDGTPIEIQVTPERGTTRGTLRPGRRGLFAPTHARASPRCFDLSVDAPSPSAITFFVLALGLALGLLFAGRRAGVPSTGFFFAFAGVFVGATIVARLASGALCTAFGGHGPGGLLLGMVAQGLALTAGGWWLVRRQRKTGVTVGAVLEPLPRGRTYAQAMFYALVGMPRAAILGLAAQGAWLALSRLQTGTPIDAFAESELGLGGAAMLLLAGAVLAPLAEEQLFRGALFAHLARFLSPWGAILASAALFGLMHVHHGVSVVGPLVMGVVLGWARATSGGLLVPFALHATFNTASLLAGVLLR
ncbi:MAG: CPBP family intramembrane metalloprotease [Sandaracinus sp.]|nr:CPBP family intramembrane metalloprotease [Sandaracinus sp.]MCB9611113.1 CPBP family intramembrane metalloprotease [Sandaracinus sp.]